MESCVPEADPLAEVASSLPKLFWLRRDTFSVPRHSLQEPFLRLIGAEGRYGPFSVLYGTRRNRS